MGCSTSTTSVCFESRPLYEEVRFLEKERRNLDKYFNRLSDKLHSRNTSEEIIHIRDIVEKSVRLVLESVSIVNKSFHWKKDPLLKVGSFYEGTQITGLNRFDYVAILDEFTPEVVSIDVRNKIQGYLPVEVALNDACDEIFANKWRKVVYDSYFIGCRMKEVNKPGLLDEFIASLSIVCSLFTPRITKFGTFSVDSEEPIIQQESYAVIKFVLTKTIEKIDSSKLVEESTERIIYVTITPAIKWGDAGDYIYPQDVHIQRFYDAIVKSGTFLVVPSPDGHFEISFTETESNLFTSISQRHKRALSVIKFLLKGDKSSYECVDESKYSIFDSYSIKMIMLALEETCPCQQGRPIDYDLYECVMHVLKVIHAGLHNHDAAYTDDWNIHIEGNVYESSERDNNDVTREGTEFGHGYESNELNENNESEYTNGIAGAVQFENNDGDTGVDANHVTRLVDGNAENFNGEMMVNGMTDNHQQLNAKSVLLPSEATVALQIEEDVPLEYDILRLLSIRMRMKVDETSLYVNCANFQELMKHDLKYWIGQRERYDLNSADPTYGVTCLTEKLKKNTVH